MRIESTSKKGNFKLFKANKVICEVGYKNWFSGEAKSEWKNAIIEIKPKNIWTSKVDIYKNDSSIGDITFNLKGQMIIRLENPRGEELNYVLKNKGKLKPKFELFNEEEVLQFALNSRNNWNKLNYDYEIQIADFDNKFDLEELLICCGYATNLYLAIISAV